MIKGGLWANLLHCKIRVGFGDYDTTTVEGIFNFGLSDNMAGKVSFTKRDQSEGFLTNLVDNEDLGRSDYTQATVNLLFNLNLRGLLRVVSDSAHRHYYWKALPNQFWENKKYLL